MLCEVFDAAIPEPLLTALDGYLAHRIHAVDVTDDPLARAILACVGSVCRGAPSRIRLAHYARGYSWEPHVDLAIPVEGGGTTDTTLLVYLTTCDDGGATVFSPIGKVPPARGSAVVFDHGVQHAAAPAGSLKRIAQFKFRRRRDQGPDAAAAEEEEEEEEAIGGLVPLFADGGSDTDSEGRLP